MSTDSLPHDHYATLGLDRTCTAEQIRAAYRLLARRHHPDVNPDDPDAVTRAQELNAAHEVLSDPVRRRAYDRELQSTAAASPKPARLERNIQQDVYLRPDELIRGVTLDVQVKDPANPHGSESYSLEVPADTAPGTRLRVARGEPFEGGWVVVRVKLRPNAQFKARSSDLQTDLRISAQRATSGGTEMVTGVLGNPLRVQIPAGVGRGEIVRVPREGLPKARGGRGDLLVRITYRPEVRITRGLRR